MSNDTRLSANEGTGFDFDFVAMARGLGRLICLFAGLVIIGIGVYCGWQLFEHIKSVVTEGQPLESAVENISKVIHAEKLNVEDPQRGIKMELGRTVSVGLVWMFYMPWMWISLGFIKAGASLVLASTGDGGRRR